MFGKPTRAVCRVSFRSSLSWLKGPFVSTKPMVSRLPAWAALVVEGARLLRESGWLGEKAECRFDGPCEPCPACSPVLQCPEAVLKCPEAVLQCPEPRLSAFAAAVAGAAVLGALAGAWLARRFDGCRRARAAPSRRGGGVVA